MADSIKHTLKKCDEITDKYLSTKHDTHWFENQGADPHMIELPIDNHHQAEEIDLRVQHSDHKKYNIIKYIENDGQILEEKVVIFNVSRLEKDLLLRNVLKPKALRVVLDSQDGEPMMKKFRAVVAE